MCYTNECCGGEGAPCLQEPPPKDDLEEIVGWFEDANEVYYRRVSRVDF